MKKLSIVTLFIASFIFVQNASAQVRVNINIGNQPAWGPAGYNYVHYYYLPEINAYYDVTTGQYIYPSGRRWIYAKALPASYRNLNLYNTYKVVVNRNYAPYRDNRTDITNYARYKNVRNQAVIRDSRNNKYYESQSHPKHNEWAKAQMNRRNDSRNNNTRRR